MASLEFATEAGISGSYDRLIDAKVRILHGDAEVVGEVRLLPIMQFVVRVPFETGNLMARWAMAPAGKGRFAKVKLSLTERAVAETHTWELQKAYIYRLEEIEFPADAHNATSQENVMLVVIRGLVSNGEDYDEKNALTMTSAGHSAKEEMAKTAASVAADLTPVVGDIKAAREAWTGRDAITGRSLSTSERVISGLSVAASIVTAPFGGEGGEILRGAKDAGKIAHGVGEAAAVVKDLGQAEAGAKAGNAALHELYKTELRRAMSKPATQDAKLSDMMSELYREGATVGSGSTADAIRHELATGELVGGKLHSQKGEDAIRALDRWLRNNPTSAAGDRAAAENVMKDLKDALGK